MNQECEVAVSSPTVVTPLFEALGIFVYLAGDAVAGGTSMRNVDARVHQADVDKVPGLSRGIFLAELRIRPNGGCFHRDRYFICGYTQDTRDVALRCWREVVCRDHRRYFVSIIPPGPCTGRDQQNHQKKSWNQHGRHRG